MLLHSPRPFLAAGESSPTSPDNFRQLDDVFLQTQTRIWLGEVLRTRLNEQRTIADLLADGELLFEVSKEIWKMIPSKRSELRAYDYEPFAFRNSGRYMPYSYVDSFLKMCKILGLDSIDLFSPSDVVEKGDTRKVCMCLRALSKKTRSLQLNVPDFDIVTHTIAMPTDMVGYIRRSWELSLSEYSSSSSALAQLPKSRQRSSQEHLNELCGRNYSSDKELSDSETNSTLQSDSTTINYLYNSSSDIGTSPCCSKKTSDENEYTSRSLNGDDVEMSSVGSVMSIYVEDESFAAESCFSHGFSQWDQKGKCQTAVLPPGNVGCDDALSQGEVTEDALQHDKSNSIVAENDGKQTTGCAENPTDSSHEDFNISCNIVENGNVNKNEETIEKLKIPELERTDTTEISKSKAPKRPILKAVVGGTAVVSATLLLLHFRNNGRDKSAELGKKSNGVRTLNGRNLASLKAQKARKEDGVYPAGKLKL